jgi:putative ABC transport system permease protein
MRLKIAIRNVFRNKRRTALSIAMIAGGVGAMLVFEGFALSVVQSLGQTTIQTQTGHLQLATNAYWNKSTDRPKDALIAGAPALQTELRKHPGIEFVSGRLSFFGLLTADDRTLSARGVSFDPQMEGDLGASFKFIDGRGFTQDEKFHVALGSGLATRLKVKTGDSLTLLSHTYDGVVNAIDVTVTGVFRVGLAEFDDNNFLIPLSSAQLLMDTDNVEQIIIRLHNTQDTDSMRAELQSRLQGGAEIKTWQEVAVLYQQVIQFNAVQNRIMEFIILSLILLGILNTVGMSVFERTGEIGTVAALGETGRTILWQFLLEGAVLGALGSLSGVVLGSLLILGINALEIKVMMPGASTDLVIKIGFFMRAFLHAGLLAVAAAILASFVPSWRASQMNIAEALRRNV